VDQDVEGIIAIMLTEYIRAAMRKAKYELLEDNEGFFATIPKFKGLWASAKTLEQCREELQSVLESWILVKLHYHDNDLPIVDRINLNAPKQRKAKVA
jgi:predicted RNase H-like HicB family nuclease